MQKFANQYNFNKIKWGKLRPLMTVLNTIIFRWAYVHISLCVCMCVYIYIYIYIYIYTHISVCVCVYIYIYIYIYIHTHTHTHTLGEERQYIIESKMYHCFVHEHILSKLITFAMLQMYITSSISMHT